MEPVISQSGNRETQIVELDRKVCPACTSVKNIQDYKSSLNPQVKSHYAKQGEALI